MVFDTLLTSISSAFSHFSADMVVFIKAHHTWAPFIVAFIAFCESVALLSILVPATVILIGVGALVGATGIEFWPIWLGATIGAIMGDWLSFWLGRHYKDAMYRVYPLSRYPEMITRGEAFFKKYGLGGVFVGRFFGPLRAVVPLIAGMCGMRMRVFQMANFSSAPVWAFLLLAPGAAIIG